MTEVCTASYSVKTSMLFLIYFFIVFLHTGPGGTAKVLIIIIIDNFCIALLSDVHKLTALYNTPTFSK